LQILTYKFSAFASAEYSAFGVELTQKHIHALYASKFEIFGCLTLGMLY